MCRIRRLVNATPNKMAQPPYRLRVRDARVFYDVTEDRVEALAVVLKSDTAEGLAKPGKSEPESK